MDMDVNCGGTSCHTRDITCHACIAQDDPGSSHAHLTWPWVQIRFSRKSFRNVLNLWYFCFKISIFLKISFSFYYLKNFFSHFPWDFSFFFTPKSQIPYSRTCSHRQYCFISVLCGGKLNMIVWACIIYVKFSLSWPRRFISSGSMQGQNKRKIKTKKNKINKEKWKIN